MTTNREQALAHLGDLDSVPPVTDRALRRADLAARAQAAATLDVADAIRDAADLLRHLTNVMKNARWRA
jgi:hypothetical protein